MSKKGGGDFGAKLGKLMTYTNDSLSSYKEMFPANTRVNGFR